MSTSASVPRGTPAPGFRPPCYGQNCDIPDHLDQCVVCGGRREEPGFWRRVESAQALVDKEVASAIDGTDWITGPARVRSHQWKIISKWLLNPVTREEIRIDLNIEEPHSVVAGRVQEALAARSVPVSSGVGWCRWAVVRDVPKPIATTSEKKEFFLS